MADDAACAAGGFRSAGQMRAAAGQAQGFHAQRAQQQQEEADALFPVDARQHFRLFTISYLKLAGESPVARAHPVQQQDHPPPGRKAEEIEKDVRQIGAQPSPVVSHDVAGHGVRPARVGRAPGGQHQGEPGRQGGK
ncbi:hypothetical protein G6F57_018272 [Rhizopus arrhizus]|nr:hypothetical protein G6F57_018272 [Rhizopus arrhizus]